VSLYPLTSSSPAETLSPDQLISFNLMLDALDQRLKMDGIQPSLLDLGPFDGVEHRPLPFPDLHWELATCWMLVDGTLPPPILLSDSTLIDYSQSLLRDPTSLERWRRKIEYSRTGFRFR
jgi:hypothetical protein